MPMSTSPMESDLIDQAWSALRSEYFEGDRPSPSADSFHPTVEVMGASGLLPSAFAVSELAVASVAAALLCAATLSELRGASVPRVIVDRGHVADAVRSERFFAIAGRSAGASFAPLSRF